MVAGKIEKYNFEYTIEDTALDDYELVEVLSEIDEGKTPLVTKAFKLLLGNSQLTELKAKVKAECGHVSATEMFNIFAEIMQTSKDTKK